MRQSQVTEFPFDPESPTPIYITPRVRLILLSAIAVAFLWLCFAAPNVPRLLILGSTVSLILSFPVRLLSRWLPRGTAIAIVIIGSIVLILLLLALLIPFAVSEISQFIESLPGTVDDLEELLRTVLADMHDRGLIAQEPDTIINNVRDTMFASSQDLLTSMLSGLVDTLSGTFNLFVTAFGVIFIATYLLIDIPRFRESFIRSWAPEYRLDAAALWQTLGLSLSRYLSGLLISIAVQGSLVTIGLILIDVPYALLLGLWMSATAILPYIGALLGAAPAVLLAATQGWQSAVLTIILYILVNQIDSNFVTPRVQANAVRVHPLMIFLAVIAGSQMMGALGAILAVPTLAMIRVLTEFFWVRLRVSGGSQETLLAAMRSDTASERIRRQSATPMAHRQLRRVRIRRDLPQVRVRKQRARKPQSAK